MALCLTPALVLMTIWFADMHALRAAPQASVQAPSKPTETWVDRNLEEVRRARGIR